MQKNSFLIYLDYEEQFNLLSNEEIGILIRAIIEYEKTKQVPKLEGAVKMAFSFIKAQLDRDREKYNKKCEKNKENIGKRWNKKNTNVQVGIRNDTNVQVGIRTDTKNTDNDNDDDNDNDIIKKENIEKKKRRTFTKPKIEEVEQYVQEKKLQVDPKQFFDYFETGNWIDSKGNKVKNWKQKVLTWSKYKDCYTKGPPNYQNYEQREYKNLNSLYANQ